MNLHETSAALLTARRALNDAELAHANAIAAEVRASVPGPWVALPEVGAVVEHGPVMVGVTWQHASHKGAEGWVAWAAVPSDEWHRAGLPGWGSPRPALDALRGHLRLCRGANGRAALALVVRLLRGWA